MAGILHIFQVGEHQHKHHQTIPEYQVNYDLGDGNSYARTFSGREPLAEFLAANAHLSRAIVDSALRALDDTGQANIPEVESPEHEAAALGLEELPSDF